MSDSQYDALSSRIEALEEMNAKLEARIVQLEKDNLALYKENQELKRKLQVYENAHTPPSKSKKKHEPKETSGKLGAPNGHPKYERKQPAPTKTIEHSKTKCPDCKHKLGKPTKTHRRIIEEVPESPPLQVTEHIINHYECKHCGKHIVAKNKLPKGMFGYNAETLTVLLRFEDRLPLRKALNALQRYGLDMSNVCVQKISKRTANKLLPAYNEQIQLLRTSNIVYADETELPIDGQTYWLWTFVGENQTIYVIRKSRSNAVAIEILGEQYTGIVCSDGYIAYKKIGSEHQRCWAHIIRESKQLNEEHTTYKCHHKNIMRAFRTIKKIRAKPPPLEKRIQLKQRLETKLQETVDAMDSHTEYKTFAVKLRNAIPSLFTCIIHLFVEPTNNIAERALRELVVFRKIIGGLRRETGAITLETISSMLTTWKQQGKNPYTTLKTAISC